MEQQSTIFSIENLEGLDQVAKQILQSAASKKIFTLTGDLGAGKTTFTQAICRQLGVRENVTSPTFSLVNEYTYSNEHGGEQIFRHLDLYRLKTIDEAIDILTAAVHRTMSTPDPTN